MIHLWCQGLWCALFLEITQSMPLWLGVSGSPIEEYRMATYLIISQTFPYPFPSSEHFIISEVIFFSKKKISICNPFFPIKDIKSANSSVDCADGNPTSTLKHFLGLSTEKEVEELWDEKSLKHFSCTFWCSHKLQKLWWSKHSSLLDNP